MSDTTPGTDAKFQIETAVDPTGAVGGFAQVKQAGADAARSVSDSAAQASKAVAGIGDAAGKSATQSEKSTSNLIASIQRATAAAQAGQKGTAAYFEQLASQRGANLDVLRPYIQGLSDAEKAQESARSGLGRMEMTAKQTAAAMRQVPAQFTDIVVSLSSGQSPMTVLLQQGGQLKDVFGGVGAAANAMGTYIAGLATPFTVVTAAVAAVAYSAYQGRQELSEYSRVLTLTGNISGTTAGQLSEMARAVSEVSGTQSNAAGVLVKLSESGQVARSAMRDVAASIVSMERAGGPAADDLVKSFASLGKDPVQAALKLNEQYGFLTASVYKQIQALAEQGRTAEAADVAQKSFADALLQRAPEMEKGLGLVEKGWRGVKDAIASARDALMDIGRVPTTEGDLASVTAKIASISKQIELRGSYDSSTQYGRDTIALGEELRLLKERQSILQSDVKLRRSAADAQADQAKNISLLDKWNKADEQFLSKKARMAKEVADATSQGQKLVVSGLLEQSALEQRIAAIREKYRESGTGQDVGEAALAKQKATLQEARQYAANLQRELEAVMAGDTTGFAKQTAAEKTAIELQAQLATGIKGVARANMEKQLAVALETVEVEKSNRIAEQQIQIQKDLVKQRDAELKMLGAEAASIQGKADALNAELSAHGKSKAAIEDTVLARMKERAAEVAMFEGSDDVVSALNAKIKAQEGYVNALKATDYKVFNEHTDELLRSSREQKSLYQDELQLTGLTALERAKVVAQRAVELKYAKELDALDKSGLSDAEKEVQRSKINEAKRIESAAASGKVIQAEYERVSNQIETSLTDALMRGFESGKSFAANLRDTVVNMFKTMVLRPIISAVVNPVAMGITGALGLTNVANAASMASGASSLFSSGLLGSVGGAISGFGTAMMSSIQSLLGITNTTSAMVASLTAAGHVAAPGMAAGAGFFNAIPGWGWALGGIAALASIFGSRSTPHAGGIAQYSADQGLQTSTTHGAFGAGFGGVDYNKEGQDLASGLAQGVTGVLDSIAKTFGKKAGYEVATAFADDSSKDGAWGALRVSLGGSKVINWDDTRSSKWAPKTFADGSEGAKQYAAAVALDVRDYLITQTPDWADAMLKSLGDAPSIEGLASTVNDINAVAAALDVMGRASKSFSGLADEATTALIKALGGAQGAVAKLASYYDNYYTEAERAAIATAKLKEDFAKIGVAMPTDRNALRALIDAATAAGDTALAAKLIELAAAFAGITKSATDAAAAAEAEAKAKADALDAARTAAMRQVQYSVDAEKSVWQKTLDAATALHDEVAGIFDTLDSAIRGLRASAASPALGYTQAQDQLARYVDAARGGYGLPTSADISGVVNAITAGISNSGLFGNSIEQAYASAAAAGDLEAIRAVAGDQLSTAEQQIKLAKDQITRLDDTLTYWQKLLDKTDQGIDTTMGVTDAVNALAKLMFPDTGKDTAKGGAGSGTGGFVIGGGGGSGAPAPKGSGYYGAGGIEINDPTQVARFDSIKAAVAGLDWSDANKAASTAVIADAARQYGVSANEIAISTGYTLEDIQRLFPDLPKYAAGGYHPGGLALVGEQGPEIVDLAPSRIYTAPQTRAMLGGTDTSRMESLLQSALTELASMRAELAQVRAATASTAQTLDRARIGDALATTPAPV